MVILVIIVLTLPHEMGWEDGAFSPLVPARPPLSEHIYLNKHLQPTFPTKTLFN